MPKYRIKPKQREYASGYYSRGHSMNRFYPDQQFSDAVMYSGESYPYQEEAYDEPTSEEDHVMVYSPFRRKKSRIVDYESQGMNLNDRSHTQYSPYSRNQKIRKPFRISKGKQSRNRNFPPQFDHSHHPYETSSSKDLEYQESRISEPDSSSYDTNSRYSKIRPPLPHKTLKHEIISNISLPILTKTTAKTLQLEIDEILSSDLPNPKTLLSKLMLRLNKSLLLSIDSYVNVVNRDENINNSYDSLISQSLEQGRIYSGCDVLEGWKDV